MLAPPPERVEKRCLFLLTPANTSLLGHAAHRWTHVRVPAPPGEAHGWVRRHSRVPKILSHAFFGATPTVYVDAKRNWPGPQRAVGGKSTPGRPSEQLGPGRSIHERRLGLGGLECSKRGSRRRRPRRDRRRGILLGGSASRDAPAGQVVSFYRAARAGRRSARGSGRPPLGAWSGADGSFQGTFADGDVANEVVVEARLRHLASSLKTRGCDARARVAVHRSGTREAAQ